jgi:hypothetical protein
MSGGFCASSFVYFYIFLLESQFFQNLRFSKVGQVTPVGLLGHLGLLFFE